MKKGYIYKADVVFVRGVRLYYHYFVFLSKLDSDKDSFLGIMLTHSTEKEFSDNHLLKPQHFHTVDEEGKKYEFQYDNTHVVHQLLEKNSFQNTTEQEKGQLTEEGLNYIESLLKEGKIMPWQEYIKKN